MACNSCSIEDTRGNSTSVPGQGAAGTEVGEKDRRLSLLLASRFVGAIAFFVLALLLSAYPGISLAFYLLAWFIAGYSVLWQALKNMVQGQVFDENFLMSLATIGAFIIGQWSEGAAVMLFFNLGELVQDAAVAKSKQSIAKLMDIRPDMARLIDGNTLHPSQVPVGSLIRVLPGEKLPLDGVVMEGQSSFDTAALTGESLPRLAAVGSQALAGFVNGSGALVIRTEAAYEQTAVSKMLELVEAARSRKAKSETFIRRFAQVYTPIVTIAALLLALLPPLVPHVIELITRAGNTLSVLSFSSFVPWVHRALVFLVISCPCAFVISVPLGFFGGIGAAARRGILVKGADALDILAKPELVVFDKTGTLTEGNFTVSQIQVGIDPDGNKYSEDYVLGLAVRLEQQSLHPLAKALVTWAENRGIPESPEAIEQVQEQPGLGLRGQVEGETLLAGSAKYLQAQGVFIPDQGVEATSIELARNGHWLGRILFEDSIKAESAQAIERLRRLGVKRIAMISGDVFATVQQTAKALNIDEFSAGLLPHQKVQDFERLAATTKGAAIFVGDGINDAPVLARADAGIAMGGIGSDAAIESADVVLMRDSPLLVPQAIESARFTRRIVAQNIGLSFIVKLAFLSLGALGIATLWEAVIADVGVALLATLNAVRARRGNACTPR